MAQRYSGAVSKSQGRNSSGRGSSQRYYSNNSRGNSGGSYRGRNEGTEDLFCSSQDSHILRYNNLMNVAINQGSSIVKDFSESFNVIGSYSEDSDKNFTFDNSNLAFLRPELLPDETTKEKSVHFDLNKGSGVEEYTGSPLLGFHNMLSWIISNSDTFRTKLSDKTGPIIVCQKNVLNAMTLIPYRFKQDIQLFGVSFGEYTFILKGTLTNYNFPQNDTVSKWAHNFKRFMTKGNYDSSIDCNSTFRVVLSTKLNEHNIVYSASTDCAQSDLYDEDLEDMSAFIGLKSILETDEQESKFTRIKMIEYFTYTLYSGCEKLIVGFRSKSGILSKLQLYDIKEMQHIGKNYWNPIICMDFTSGLLTFINEKCNESPGTVFRFDKVGGISEITCTEDSNPPQIVPDWFFESLNA